MCLLACSLSHVWLFVTPWTVTHQVPLSWHSSGKNTAVGCHFLLQGNLPDLEIKPPFCTLTGKSLPAGHMWANTKLEQWVDSDIFLPSKRYWFFSEDYTDYTQIVFILNINNVFSQKYLKGLNGVDCDHKANIWICKDLFPIKNDFINSHFSIRLEI